MADDEDEDENENENENERSRRERDFYRSLLELNEQDEIEPLLKQALELITEASGARLGYIVVGERPHEWDTATGCEPDELAIVRDAISHSIIDRAISSGKVVQTPSALLDPRFQSKASVRKGQIEAVLCTPISGPSVGVIYLQGSSGGGPFADEDVKLLEYFARHIGHVAYRLLSKAKYDDPTQQWRDRIEADRIVGRSQSIARLLEQIHHASRLNIDVLLDGPTGAGKTLVADVIAANAAPGKPFVALNCATIPANLLESELFGYEEGAHSTAHKAKPGLIETADGGTLFLDEIAELSPAAQSKLLKFLETRSFLRLGATQPRTVDVRIIAASNVSLATAVAEGKFREDLMYRLAAFEISVPALSKRRRDIPELAEVLCSSIRKKLKLGNMRLSADAIAALTTASWPGNVRQLHHAIRAAMVRASGLGVELVRASHLFPDRSTDKPSTACLSWQEATLRFQIDYLTTVLTERNGNVSRTARDLELSRSYVNKFMKAHGIQRPT